MYNIDDHKKSLIFLITISKIITDDENFTKTKASEESSDNPPFQGHVFIKIKDHSSPFLAESSNVVFE